MLEALGTLAGGALGQLGEALSLPRQLLWGGGQAIYNALTGGSDAAPKSGTELLGRLGMDTESPLTKALGFGAEVATDPLTYMGGLLGRGASKLAGAAAAPEMGAMLNARRGFGVFKGVDPSKDAISALAGSRLVGNAGPLGGVAKELEAMSPLLQKGGEAMYSPANRAAFITQNASPTAARHEIIHGMVDAATAGNGAGLPWPIRVAGAIRRSDSPFMQGIGNMANEAVAHGLEHRGVMNQLAGAGKFLMGQDPVYRGIFAQSSPLAAALYMNMPNIAKGAGVAGGLGVGAGIGSYLGG